MSTTSRVAGAVAAGYALGRFKKLRLAVLVATAMSSPKFRSAAAGMLQDRLPGGAITGTLTKEVGGRLVDVGKTAATSIVASRIDSLSQSLAERSENLRKPGGQAGADESVDDRGSEEPTDEYEEEEGEEAEEPTDEYEEEEGEEAEEPTDEYEEEEGEEARRAHRRVRRGRGRRSPKSPQTSTKRKRAKKPKSPQTSTKSKRLKSPKGPQTSPRSKRHPETRSPKSQ